MRRLGASGLLLVTLSTGACASGALREDPSVRQGSTPGIPGAPSSTVAGPAVAIIPRSTADFHPSQMRLVGGKEGAGARLADVDTCEGCHLDIAATWRASAHAFSSFNNPVYRTVVERFRKDRGNEKSLFCAGCHDIALMVDGKMASDVDPGDLRAYAGISCRTCHGISGTRPDGNGSFDLDASDVPLPRDKDPDSVLRHKAVVGRAPLRTAQLCVACHRAFLDASTGNAHHLIGQDDATPWMRSAYAGSHGARIDDVDEKDCRGCHMTREPTSLGEPTARNGAFTSHRFTGAHTWLASMIKDPDQERRAAEFLRGSASIDVAGVALPSGRVLVEDAPIVARPGSRVAIEVVVRNERTGHRFPGGVMDAEDVWIEVVVDDARGRRVADAGTEHEASGRDPSAHRFVSYMAGTDGIMRTVRETHEFAANVYNHTIPPRDAALVAYDLAIPPTLGEGAFPLAVTARLRHRTRNRDLQKAACDATLTDRGRAFGKEGLKKVARALDPCRPQPVTDIGESRALLSFDLAGTTVKARPAPAGFARTYAYALGLSHVVQERLEEAKVVTERARALASSPRERAAATQLLADILARQGMVQDTRTRLAEAESLAPGHPASARILGETYKTTWQWDLAAPHLARAAKGAPKDDTLWADLAIVRAGSGDPRGAMEATATGLVLQPRDGDMLRVQALALPVLGGDADVIAQAHAAFVERRSPDNAPGIRNRCNLTVPGCANERLPVHAHPLRVR